MYENHSFKFFNALLNEKSKFYQSNETANTVSTK